jgi:predicted membrane-bound spermidine synthase
MWEDLAPSGDGVPRRPFFLFFLVSGACGLVHEVVWIRLAMALFGTTTPSVATVLSVFMAGLAIGSFGAGRLARRLSALPPRRFLELYAASEIVIALSALVVPAGLAVGRRLLTDLSRDTAWQDAGFLVSSGAVVVVTILPFAIAMGATFPLAMAAIRGEAEESPRSFGYLYAANVLGAALGVLASGFVLIELLGFRKTLLAAGAANAALAVASFLLARRPAAGAPRGAPPSRAEAPGEEAGSGDRAAIALLFTTGFVSMAMEVVWIRMFTPYLGPVVYAFSSILAIYLGATFLGSWTWRFRTGARGGPVGAAWLAAALLSLLVLPAADPRIPIPAGVFTGPIRTVLALPAFCAVLGWLTPRLVDLASRGDPARAGRAYAANVIGCILGPLVAGFGLLPALGERGSIVSLAALLLVAAAAFHGREIRASVAARPVPAAAALAAAIVLVLSTRSFETLHPGSLVRRDYEATVVAATERESGAKKLFVNGFGMTYLTPVTKMMVHVPLSMAKEPPANALVICFGMGTSFRSAMAWGIPVTSVELVPSVPGLFGYYHEDGPALLRSPLARIVIDDGRRFLERSRERWDLIVVDPPPPPEAAGSSLLYSKEFCALARSRLRPGGIFQQWLPAENPDLLTSVTRAVVETFPHVRAFRSCELQGIHYFASDRPIEVAPPAVLAGRLPPAAVADLMEWWPGRSPASALALVTTQEIPIETLLAADPRVGTLTDDAPINEYCLLRRSFGW